LKQYGTDLKSQRSHRQTQALQADTTDNIEQVPSESEANKLASDSLQTCPYVDLCTFGMRCPFVTGKKIAVTDSIFAELMITHAGRAYECFDV